MEFRIIKSSIPIIWLDTSVIIRLTKLKYGEKISEIDQERYSILFDVILEKVRGGKLICPEGDQDEEIEMGQRLVKECHDIHSTLSLGIRFLHRGAIEDEQFYNTMKAYIDNPPEVTISYRQAFYRDPVEKLKNLGRVYVAVHLETPEVEVLKKKTSKSETIEKIEQLRQEKISKGITFEQQLIDEYTGRLQAGIYALRNWIDKTYSGIFPTIEETYQAQILIRPLAEWGRLQGKPEGVEGLVRFLFSETYKGIPIIEISTKLWAKLTTSPTPIQSGDSMDVLQLSAVIPYCDYVITDKKMKNRIVDLGIDKKYNTKIFCMKDFENLMDELESL